MYKNPYEIRLCYLISVSLKVQRAGAAKKHTAKISNDHFRSLNTFSPYAASKKTHAPKWYDPPKADKVNNQTALGGFFYGQTVWFSVFVFPNLLAANSISCCLRTASPQGIDAQASQGGVATLTERSDETCSVEQFSSADREWSSAGRTTLDRE